MRLRAERKLGLLGIAEVAASGPGRMAGRERGVVPEDVAATGATGELGARERAGATEAGRLVLEVAQPGGGLADGLRPAPKQIAGPRSGGIRPGSTARAGWRRRVPSRLTA